MAGLIPKFARLRDQARETLSESCFHYFDGGAEDEITLLENREAWKRFKLVPRVLRDVSTVDTTWKFLDQEFEVPVIVAPMSMQCWAHEEGELATAKAAAKCGVPYGLSMLSSKGLQDINELEQKPFVLSQLYILDDENFSMELIQEYYETGARCFVVTVDAPRMGNRERHTKNMFEDPELKFALSAHKSWKEFSKEGETWTAIVKRISKTIKWDIIQKIKDLFDAKVFLKGILSVHDAKLALDHGVDGIIISNHGGRQVDTAVTALDVLSDISRAVGGKIPVLVDGGVQRGTDIIKAIALGASGVLIGRPVLFALAVEGEQAVTQILTELKQELERNMALCGCTCLAEITSELIFKHNMTSFNNS